MSTLMLISDTALVVAAAGGGDGILGWVNTKSGQATSTLQIVGGLIALGFFIKHVVRSGFTATTLVMAGLMAAFFTWLVNNIMTVEDKVDEEINSAPLASQVVARYDVSDI